MILDFRGSEAENTNLVPGQEQRMAVLWVEWMQPDHVIADLKGKFHPGGCDADKSYVDSAPCKCLSFFGAGSFQ